MKKKLHLLTFWAINGQLDIDSLKSQLKDMKECGYDGTIFHPRYYPGLPAFMGQEYLAIISETILYAKELGMEFWIYDENGWPSGSADGKVKDHFPDRTCDWMIYENGQVKFQHKKNFNTLDREEMQYYIQLIFDGYRLGLKEEAFSYIKGFFSDEVGFLDGHGVSMECGGIPWCLEAQKRMEDIYGQDQLQYELLFTCKEGYQEFRSRYWQILTDILAESFYEAINTWCERYGKRYTAHLKGEENIFFQIPFSGSCFANLKKVNTPAVDALERYPGNHYYPRIVSSLSRQFQDGQCLVEALGGSGWGLTPADMEKYVEWLAESGINYFTFHLWQYQRSAASMRDWPPNIPCGLTWKACMKPLNDRLHEKWDKEFAKQRRDWLLVAPVRGCMADFDPVDAMVINGHNGSRIPDTKSGKISEKFARFVEQMYTEGMPFDVTDERILEEYGKLEEGKLHIGNAVYSHVVFGEDCRWESEHFRQLNSNEYRTEQPIMAAADIRMWNASDFVWQMNYLPEMCNQIPIEWEDGKFMISYTEALAGNMPDCQIRFSDHVKKVSVNGLLLEERMEGEFPIYTVPAGILISGSDYKIEIEFEALQNGEKNPFSFLEGNFLVKNTEPYKVINERALQSEGTFYLDVLPDLNDMKLNCRDLVTSGFPFCEKGISVCAQCYIGEDGILCLDTVNADSVKVTINGDEYGYLWDKDWKLETGLAEGIYYVELELIPSTYNSNGPHHYMLGDHWLISPDQYSGVKNFVDSLDAPENTFIPEWNFVRFGIGR